jgi:L-seryl-tRNA(Ser) seleniumtransferase
MSLYEELGVRPVINAAGTLTRLGGSRLSPAVLAAMAEASASFVHIDELQAKAGEVIAEITGAEAGYVTNGAAAGLALATAACVAGMDVAAMDRLPDTTGLPNEVVVQKGHRNSYDHAIRMPGLRHAWMPAVAGRGRDRPPPRFARHRRCSRRASATIKSAPVSRGRGRSRRVFRR